MLLFLLETVPAKNIACFGHLSINQVPCGIPEVRLYPDMERVDCFHLFFKYSHTAPCNIWPIKRIAQVTFIFDVISAQNHLHIWTMLKRCGMENLLVLHLFNVFKNAIKTNLGKYTACSHGVCS